MKCARLQLQERFKPKLKAEACPPEKPRRYCQKRLVNPAHEEDPRWTDVYERFHCNVQSDRANALESARANQHSEDLYLTVQTLRFQGDVDQSKRPRTSFKYKTLTDSAKHRMFVKQVVANVYSDDDRSSQLTSYYFDDYAKYLSNNDKSRPASGKSSIFLQGLSNKRENKATQLDEQTGIKISQNLDSTVKSLYIKRDKQEIKDEIRSEHGDINDTQITFRKSGKRKSLTISRTQSPETVQVIRVDVVCNYSTSSALSDGEDKKIESVNSDFNVESVNLKGSHFADKYLLTNTIKKLDESLSGAKVTLLCKTFTLTERATPFPTNRFKTNSDEKLKSKETKKSTSRNKSSVNTKIRKQIKFL